MIAIVRLDEASVPPSGSPAAVLFDMDGTLVATEHYWGEALAALARRLGGELSVATREATVGTSMRTSMELIHAELGLVRSDEQVRADGRWVENRTAELMARGGIAWQPGARELVTEVRAAGIASALVTTTPRRLASLVLDRMAADLGELPFDVTVCGDEVPARKPDPAPYRQAMALLEVAADRSLVIEDSLVGIASGLAAGAAVLGVPTLQPVEPTPGLVLRRSLADLGLAALADVLRRASEARAVPSSV